MSLSTDSITTLFSLVKLDRKDVLISFNLEKVLSRLLRALLSTNSIYSLKPAMIDIFMLHLFVCLVYLSLPSLLSTFSFISFFSLLSLFHHHHHHHHLSFSSFSPPFSLSLLTSSFSPPFSSFFSILLPVQF